MANHLGIELVPSLCRIVVAERRTGLFRRHSGGQARVTAFHELPYHPTSPGQLTDELRRLGLRGPATVAVWGLRGDYRVMSLPPAAPADLEAMARREAGAGTGGGEVSDAVMPGEAADGGRRQVTYLSVAAADVRTSIRPLTEAGIDVAHVLTPAQAHVLVARQRLGVTAGSATAVLAVHGRVTGLTVVRGGAVLVARELPWGYETERAVPGGGAGDAGEFVARLGSELRRSLLYVKQQHQAEVSQVLLCGDVPDLRALTGPLMHDLNLDVETLDSPDGLDVTQLPEPADDFRFRIGALRTAWALAASEAPTVNLLPRGGTTVRRRLTTGQKNHMWRAVAAGLIITVLAWGAIELLTRTTRDRTSSLRREIAALEPEVQRMDAMRLARTSDAARIAALEAFTSEGPRLARMLEALGRAAPPEVAISSLVVGPGAGTWNVTVTGQALAPTPAEAQAAFNTFAKALTSSDHLGIASQAPEIRVRIEEPAPPVRIGADLDPTARRLATAAPEIIGYWEALPRGVRSRQPARRDGGGERERVVNGIAYRWVDRPVDQTRRRETASAPEPGRDPGPAKYAGAVLDFTLRYEVRK